MSGMYPATWSSDTDARERSALADVRGVPVNLSSAQVKRLRAFMADRAIPGDAESLIAGLIQSGEGEITDATIDETMALIDQYIALHGPDWMAVLQGRADASDDDPSQAIEPRLN